MENFEFIEQIGEGTSGRICKIQRKSDKKILVWKELDYGRMQDKEKQQLVSEVNILRELKHPNIVRYYDRLIDKQKQKIYIIMEFCEGGDLLQMIRKTKKEKELIPEDYVCRIFMHIVLALHEIHRRKDGTIIHRDMKPANIFLDSQNNMKLGDFGISKILQQEDNFAYTNIGTPYYIAPEQLEQPKYSEKTDIWGLGCLLYEICALQPPFKAQNQLSLAMKIKQGKFERIPHKYSDEMQRVITWCLQKNSDQRPSVDDLLNLPQISIRLREKRLKENLLVLQKRQDEFIKKEEEINNQEQQLKIKEKELSDREIHLQQEEKNLLSELEQLKNQESLIKQQNLENQMQDDFHSKNKLQYYQQKQYNENKIPQYQEKYQDNRIKKESSRIFEENKQDEQISSYLSSDEDIKKDKQIHENQNNYNKELTNNPQNNNQNNTLNNKHIFDQKLINKQISQPNIINQRHFPSKTSVDLNGINKYQSNVQKYYPKNEKLLTPNLEFKNYKILDRYGANPNANNGNLMRTKLGRNNSANFSLQYNNNLKSPSQQIDFSHNYDTLKNEKQDLKKHLQIDNTRGKSPFNQQPVNNQTKFSPKKYETLNPYKNFNYKMFKKNYQ